MKVTISPIVESGTPVTVPELYERVGDQLVALGYVDVVGTVTSWRLTNRRWARAEIACLDSAGNAVGKLSVGVPPETLIRNGPIRVGSVVAVNGLLETHVLYTPLQLRARAVTLVAEVAAPVNELREYLARLDGAGQTRANARRVVPDPIGRVGLVTPVSGGAGLEDPMLIMSRSSKPLQVATYAVAMMGPGSARAVAEEIRLAATGCEVVLLCRGGGATADLAAFNSVEVVEAIVSSPVPVVTGIGHAHDSTAAGSWVVAVNGRREALAERAVLVAGRRDLVDAAAVKERAAGRVRMALILVAVLVVLIVLLAAAGR